VTGSEAPYSTFLSLASENGYRGMEAELSGALLLLLVATHLLPGPLLERLDRNLQA